MTNGTGKPKHLQELAMTAKVRDFEFCSGGEEDEYLEVEVHSPTDSSEDSVEVKVSPICSRNKRKCAEPRKVKDVFAAPPKKRMCFKAKSDISLNTNENPEPFRPWSAENTRPLSPPKTNPSKEITLQVPFLPPNGCSSTTTSDSSDSNFITTPQATQPEQALLQSFAHQSEYIRPHSLPSPPEQKPFARSPSPAQPLPLVKKSSVASSCTSARERKPKQSNHPALTKIKTECDAQTIYPCDLANLRVPLHPHLASLTSTEAERLIINSADIFPNLQQPKSEEEEGCSSRKEQRNYKNMTRERRIEANARERTRVHTISAAFETLRRSVPSYSHNQKLSKLSVLRIACSYIMTLSTLVGGSAALEANPSLSLAECVDSVSKTIQKEGKLRKKKDDTD